MVAESLNGWRTSAIRSSRNGVQWAPLSFREGLGEGDRFGFQAFYPSPFLSPQGERGLYQRAGGKLRQHFAAVVLGMAVIHLLMGCQKACNSDATTQKVLLAGKAFELELALDKEGRFQGLSDRSEIVPTGGMLFVFPQPGKLQFVMRRCLVPIDLIYLDPGGRIITTYAMAVEPLETPEGRLPRYPSRYDAQFAIELKGGTLQQLNLTAGTKIDLPLDRLKHRAR